MQTWAHDIRNDTAASVALLRFLMWIALINTRWTVWLLGGRWFSTLLLFTLDTRNRTASWSVLSGIPEWTEGKTVERQYLSWSPPPGHPSVWGGSKQLPGDFTLGQFLCKHVLFLFFLQSTFTLKVSNIVPMSIFHLQDSTNQEKKTKTRKNRNSVLAFFLLWLLLFLIISQPFEKRGRKIVDGRRVTCLAEVSVT